MTNKEAKVKAEHLLSLPQDQMLLELWFARSVDRLAMAQVCPELTNRVAAFLATQKHLDSATALSNYLKSKGLIK